MHISYPMTTNTIQQEFHGFVEAIDAKRTEIINMKSEDVAQELFKLLSVENPDKYMDLLRCFKTRATHTVESWGLSQIHETMRGACAVMDEVLYSDKFLDETGAQFIQTIRDTAKENKVDLDKAFADLDSPSTDKKNSATIDIIMVISALLKKGYNVYDLLWN